jgi:hypothetical protein
MLGPGLDLVAGGAESRDGLRVSLDHDAYVTRRASLRGGGIGDEHQVDLGARMLEPRCTPCDSRRRRDRLEAKQTVENRAFIELGGLDLPCDVLNHEVRNPQIAIIGGKRECSTGL